MFLYHTSEHLEESSFWETSSGHSGSCHDVFGNWDEVLGI